MKTQKGFVPVIIILVVLIGFVGVYFLGTLKNKPSTVNPTALPTAVVKESSSPTVKPVVALDPTTNWKTYTSSKNGFSIKYPETWRILEGSFFGTGPKEIGEDILWAANYFDINTNSANKIIDDLGKQFSDRKQVTNKIKVGGLNATQVITTTQTIPDWYLEVIIFEDADTIFTVGNGAIKDENLQKMVGVPAGTKFKDFYSSFKLLN